MTEHIETKHKIQAIGSRRVFFDILDNSTLSETEKKMMVMYYVDHKDMLYIADELGYSETGIKRMHKRILKKIESMV